MDTEFVVDRYEIVEHGMRRETAAEPDCSRKKGHCWHDEGLSGFVIRSGGGYREVCCWCNTTKTMKRNPDAHGAFDPRQREYRMQA